MIVVDTSALMAILLGEEPAATTCIARLAESEAILSAGTWIEALIVAGRRGVRAELERLVEGLHIGVVPVTRAAGERAADAYARWGKGAHPAALNFGDCFAYALAAERDLPLLFVGDDFSRTDVVAA